MVADLVPVDIHIGGVVDSIKVQVDTLVLPGIWQSEVALVLHLHVVHIVVGNACTSTGSDTYHSGGEVQGYPGMGTAILSLQQRFTGQRSLDWEGDHNALLRLILPASSHAPDPARGYNKA